MTKSIETIVWIIRIGQCPFPNILFLPLRWSARHPSIQDIAVVGLDDITWGQVVAAIIVTKPDTSIDLDTLRKWCGDKMPKYWIPKELVILPEMPRNAMGKINKKELVKTLFSK